MAVICTKCGSTDVLCEALVNPNTEKVVSYHDGAFMYGYCNNCKDESMLTDTEGVKCDMENKYRQFCKVRKKKPDYAECQIVWKEDGKVMGEHYYNKFVHEFNGNILKMIGYFRGSEKEGQVFCDMITERIEKYEKRMPYDKGKLNN